MKNISRLLVYISIGFVLAYLISYKDVSIPDISSYNSMTFSFLCLILGFFLQAKVWQNLLIIKGQCINCDFKFSFASEYLSIFSKYIPGKIWTIVGPSFYVSAHKKISLKLSTYIATFFQLLIIWSGIVASLLGLYDYLNFKEYLLVLIIVSIFSLFFFNKNLFGLLTFLIKKLFGLELDFIPVKKYFKSIIYLFLQWLFWGIGFIFLISSFYKIEISYELLVIFPIAGTLGLLAIITPGGLGVREGVIVFFLMKNNMSFEEATAISIVSRLWFLTGEGLIFLIAYLIHKKIIHDE